MEANSLSSTEVSFARKAEYDHPAFSRSLEAFRRRLSAEDIERLELTTFEDLQNAIRQIQSDQAQRRTLRNLNKIKPLLHFLQDYARVIEQFVSVKPDFLAFIWGPIKLCLKIASRLDEAFDALLDAYARIGEALPIFSAIDGLSSSQGQDHVQQILADVYEDILTFHKRALVFFKQPAWRIAFRTTIHSFGDKFGDVVKNLERSKELLFQSASVSQFQEAQDSRLIIAGELKAQREHERLERRMTTVNWLSSVSWSDQHEEIQMKRREYPGTARWTFTTAPFCDWLRNDDGCSSIFWLYGIPGAGKTFLFNSIIDEVKGRLPWAHVVYFYCRYNDQTKRTLYGIASSLITQILALNPACLPYLYDKALSSGESTLRSTRLCMNILTKLAEYHDQLVIGIDGLDECEEPEKCSVLEMIESISKATRATRNVNIILTSRKEPAIERSLRSATSLEIKPHHLERDIKSYVQVRTSTLGKLYAMDAERQHRITAKVSQRSQGMFLLARLIMDNLVDQDCEEALEGELNNEILPRGIDEAYGRILVRMQKVQTTKSWERAKLALDLIVMATRSVKICDLQGALSICTQDGSIKYWQRRSVKPLDELLGPMVEVHPDDTVALVHPTAKDFLLQHHSNHFINSNAANLRLARLCTSYLTFRCFDPYLDSSSIKKSVELGEYAFQEYATFSWIHHLGSVDCIEMDSNRDEELSLKHILASLRRQHLEDTGLRSENNTVAKDIDVPEELLYWRRLFENVETLCRENDRQEPLPHLLRRLLKVREIVEELSLQKNQESSMLTEAYGKFPWKCTMIRCPRFFQGFAKQHQRDKHIKSHSRSHRCLEATCDYSELGFATQKELVEHAHICHITPSEDITFPNVRLKSPCTALKDAIDRDDDIAIRDICDPGFVETVSETGFLLRAILKRNLKAAMAIVELLGTASEVSYQDKRGRTALHEAAVEVNCETLLQEMLKIAVDFHPKDLHGETPLSKALTVGCFQAVRLLLSSHDSYFKSSNIVKQAFKRGVILAAAAGEDDIIQSIWAVTVSHIHDSELWEWISTALNTAGFHSHESTVALILKLNHALGIEKYYTGMLKENLLNGLEVMTKLLMEHSRDPELEVNSKDKETSHRALRAAAERGDSVAVMAFFASGADVDYGSRKLPTALAVASSNNQLLMMRLLLDRGAKVDAYGGKWTSPLGAASSKGQVAAIRLLIDNGADPDNGMYPASCKGQSAVIKLLLGQGANVNAQGDLGDALHAACYNGHKGTVKELLLNRAGIYARGEIADIEFGQAWSREQEEHVSQMFQNEKSTSGRRGLYSALCVACSQGRRNIVPLVIKQLESGAQTKGHCLGKYSLALYAACRKGLLEAVELLLRSGADPSYQSERALQVACYLGEEKIVQLLLDYGADVNGYFGDQPTALISAIIIGAEFIVRLLLRKGADVNAQLTSETCTALIVACRENRRSMVQLLLQHGADVHVRILNAQPCEVSALSAASYVGNVDIVRMLLENGAEVDAESGETQAFASREKEYLLGLKGRK